VISSSQRPLPDNTQHSQQAEICDPGGIQIHNPCRRAAADLRFRPRGHWDRPLLCRISSTVYHIHKWLASGGRQGSISGQSREVDRVVLGRLSLLVFQISPVSILPFSIPLSVSFHPAFPCQYSSTQQSPVSVPLPIIPMAVSFYPAFPFQYPSIQHSLVSILVPSIPLSVSFYPAFPCQYPSTQHSPVSILPITKTNGYSIGTCKKQFPFRNTGWPGRKLLPPLWHHSYTLTALLRSSS